MQIGLTQKRVGRNTKVFLTGSGTLNTAVCYPAPMELGDRIREEREKREWSQGKLAAMAGTNQPTTDRLERSVTKHSKYLNAVLHVLGIERTCQIVGFVGAGSGMHYYADSHSPAEYVPMPLGGTDATVAAQIKGDSLGRGFRGWLVYYDDIRNPPTADLFGELCVVGLEDDQVLVKYLKRGSKPGLYNLESNTESTIEDVLVRWAARVNHMSRRNI